MTLSIRKFHTSRGALILALAVLPACSALAQTNGAPRILYPQPNQDVRGEINVQFDGIPDGGYAVIKVDGKWLQATSDTSYFLNTFPPTFAGDGPHKLTVTAVNASGKVTGRTDVTFNVANGHLDTTTPGILLTHFTDEDANLPVLRYRIFAESNATTDAPEPAAGGAAGAMGIPGMLGPGIPANAAGLQGGGTPGAPAAGAGVSVVNLDWQVSALMRRVVRDVNLMDGAANIRSVIQQAMQRQRQGAGGLGGPGGPGGPGGGYGAIPVGVTYGPNGPVSDTGAQGGMPGIPGMQGGIPGMGGPPGLGGATPALTGGRKPPWSSSWQAAPELGQYYVKLIKPSGEEINALHKPTTLVLADLLPTFPDSEVRPGSTWETTMTFVGDLSSRQAINVNAPITFTSYDTLRTPGGQQRRVAKLETQFRLPEAAASKIASRLGGGNNGGPGAFTSGGTSSVSHATTTVKRTIYFDVLAHKVLRSEDEVQTDYEIPSAAGAAGGAPPGVLGGPPTGYGGPGIPGMMGQVTGAFAAENAAIQGAAGEGGGAPGGYPGMPGMGGAGVPGVAIPAAAPTKVHYHLSVITWLDDAPPKATDLYKAGAGTAHSRDNAQDPSLALVTREGATSIQ